VGVKLAVFIINYNGASSLGDLFLKALESFTTATSGLIGVDIWLVDNGSLDNSLEEARSRFGASLKYVRLSRNLGYGGACYLAYIYTLYLGLRYDYYVCSNNDIIVSSKGFKELIEWLHRLSRVFGNGFIASPILGNGSDGLDNGSYYIDSFGEVWPLTLISSSPEKLAGLLLNKPIPVSYADGAFMVFHWKAVENAFFDPKLFLYSEDAEASLRGWQYGVPSLLVPVVLGDHYRNSTTRKVKPISIYTSVRNGVYVSYRYLGVRGFIGSLVARFVIMMKNMVLITTRGHGRERLLVVKLITRGIIDSISLVMREGKRYKPLHAPVITVPLVGIVLRRRAYIIQDKLKKIFIHHIRLWHPVIRK